MKILVTGAGALLGQGIIKSLRMASTPYYIIAADPDPRAVGLYWANKAEHIPEVTNPRYLESVCRIIDKERPDAVLIGTDVELEVFAFNKAQLESTYGTHVIVSPPRVIQIANDKWLTYQFLKSHSFPHPLSALPENVNDLLSECDFPLIVKPRSGARSVGVHKVSNTHELDVAINKVCNPIIQECVSTPEHEYTSGILLTDNIVKAVVTMRRDLRDGNTYRAYVEMESSFDSSLSLIAKELGGYGPLNFQFRLDNGIPKIFEINARFSGTTPMRAHAGFNEVDILVRHYVNGDPIPTPILRPVVLLRFLDELVVGKEQLLSNDANYNKN